MGIGIWSRVAINRWSVCGIMLSLSVRAAADLIISIDAGDQIMPFINAIGALAWLFLSVVYGKKPAVPNDVVINIVQEG